MKTDFSTYEEARSYAQTQANTYRQSYGIEKNKSGLPGYGPWVVKMIPNNPKNRYGWEYLCEPVEPETKR